MERYHELNRQTEVEMSAMLEKLRGRCAGSPDGRIIEIKSHACLPAGL
jgi:hypothetical protein